MLRMLMHRLWSIRGLAALLLIANAAAGALVPSSPPASDVPSWARQAIWYQIFPERFRNGDPGNDPTVKDISGTWPNETPKEWHVSLWTGDWYKFQPWETADGKGFYYRVQQRRYGGDLQGVLDKLDYLVALGVNAIYFNPLFESPSLHKYGAAMYHHVDKNFGPDPDGDRKIWATEKPADPTTWKRTSADSLFLRLVHEAHRRGMKVILDGVFNHVGTTFWAFEDVRNNGPRSAYKDWFQITSWDDPSTPANEFDYKGWSGVKDLPQFNRDSNTLAPGPREHIKAVVRWWMDPHGTGDPSDGIDGWRLDVAEKVPLGFWREFRTWVRAINPQAYITGEVWWEDHRNNKMYDAAPWLQGDAFDAVMNYRWAREVCRFFKDRKLRITVSEFDRRLNSLRKNYRSDVNYVLMNLLDSHDTDRLPSMIVNPDLEYDHNASPSGNAAYDVRKPNPAELQIQKLMVLYQMTSLGAPMVYYGDEAGMWGGDDPDERKPMLWDDMTYENEASHPFGKPRPSDANLFNRDLFKHYQTLIAIRKAHAALSLGEYRTLLTDDARDLYAFLRSYGTDRVLVVINNSSDTQDVRIPLDPELRSGEWKNLLTTGTCTIARAQLRISLPGKSGAILEGAK
jgi:cyclomaltodextrinase